MWLRRARSQSIPINGPLIRAKAEEFVLQLGITDFLCSEGWLTRFKERNGLVFRTIAKNDIAGEAAAADATACRDWRAGRLPEIMQQFKEWMKQHFFLSSCHQNQSLLKVNCAQVANSAKTD